MKFAKASITANGRTKQHADIVVLYSQHSLELRKDGKPLLTLQNAIIQSIDVHGTHISGVYIAPNDKAETPIIVQIRLTND